MVRDFEDFRQEVEVAGVVLAGEEPAGLVVQIASEEVAEATVDQAEDDGVAVDGVRGGVALEVFFVQTQRFVADARGSGRIAEEAERGLPANFGDQRAEDFNSEVALVEE